MPALSEKDKLDRLAAELDAEDESTESEGAVDQSDIDALLAEFQNAAEPTSEPAAQVVASPDDETSDEALPDRDDPKGGPIGQDDIDRLLAGEASAEEADEAPPATAESAALEAPTEADELSDQEKMDRLIAELQEESLKETAEPDEAATAEDIAPEVEDEPPQAPDPEDPEPDDFDALDDDEMDLDGYEDPEMETEPPPPVELPAEPAPDAPVDDVDGGDQEDAVADPPPDEAPSPPPAAPEEVPLETRLERRQARRRAVALEEKKAVRRWPRWAMSAVLLAVAAIGGALGYRYVDTSLLGDNPAPVGPAAAASASVSVTDTVVEPSSADTSQDPQPLKDGLERRFAQIDTARQSIIDKQNEILQLRRDYEEGIRDIETAIVREAQSRNIKRYQDAAAVEAIDYGLRTIQRRLAYIKRLDAPVQRLYNSGEALLYAKRMGSVNLMLVGLAEGIDSTLIGQQMDAALAAHPVEAALQLPQEKNKPGISLETIWQRIVTRMGSIGRAADASSASAPAVVAAKSSTDDIRIWNALCEGDFSDKYQVTSLSADAGGCLAGWQGTELFLNRLVQLDARAAGALSAWHGQWMAMNRIETLSAAAAKALFQWKGSRLSLNGLRQMPDGAAEALANWPGKELELMGLERLSVPIAKALAHWKRGGGRLFIPEKFYRKQ